MVGVSNRPMDKKEDWEKKLMTKETEWNGEEKLQQGSSTKDLVNLIL